MSDRPPPCFRAVGVTYAYPGAATPALREVSVELPRGRTTVIVGPNAAGKSTLLYLLGLLWDGALAGGAISYFDGTDTERHYAALGPEERAHLRLSEFGFVPQSCYLLPNLTWAENVALPLLLKGGNPAECVRAVEGLLAQASDRHKDLLERKDALGAMAVSGGQKQRMAVLRALAAGPRVLLADEPFKEVSQDNLKVLLDLLQRWRAGEFNGAAAAPEGDRTLVVVSHDFGQAYRLGEYFVKVSDTHQVVDGRAFAREEFDGPEALQHWATRQEDADER